MAIDNVEGAPIARRDYRGGYDCPCGSLLSYSNSADDGHFIERYSCDQNHTWSRSALGHWERVS